MEHKALVIGGGIAAVFVGAVVFLKMRAGHSTQSSATAQDTTSFMPNAGYYYSGSVPSSGGYVSTADSTPSQSDNSGSTATGGGFDVTTLLAGIAAATATNNATQIAANAHTADSAILASIPVPVGGSASVVHSSDGTTVSTVAPPTPTDPVTAMLTAEYQNVLGRAPDADGLAYWKSRAASDPNFTPALMDKEFHSSDEYKRTHPNG